MQVILGINWERGQGWQRAARPPEVRAYHRDTPRRAPRPTRAPTPLTPDLITQEKKEPTTLIGEKSEKKEPTTLIGINSKIFLI